MVLPEDIALVVLSYLEITDILNMEFVSKFYRKMSQKVINFNSPTSAFKIIGQYKKIPECLNCTMFFITTLAIT